MRGSAAVRRKPRLLPRETSPGLSPGVSGAGLKEPQVCQSPQARRGCRGVCWALGAEMFGDIQGEPQMNDRSCTVRGKGEHWDPR